MEARVAGENAALALRHRLALGLEPADLALIAGELGVAVALHDFGERSPDGMYVWDGELPLIVLNRARRPQRLRFTLAHELGHHELHRFRGAQRLVDVDVTDAADAAGAHDPDEVAANSFAAHLLLPAAALAPGLAGRRHATVTTDDVVALVRRFRVSWEMVCYRLKSEGLLRDADLERLLGLPRAAILEASGLGPEHFALGLPELPAQLAVGAAQLWAAWVITNERLAQILEIDVDAALAQMTAWGIAREDPVAERAARGAEQLAAAGIDLDALIDGLEPDPDDE